MSLDYAVHHRDLNLLNRALSSGWRLPVISSVRGPDSDERRFESVLPVVRNGWVEGWSRFQFRFPELVHHPVFLHEALRFPCAGIVRQILSARPDYLTILVPCGTDKSGKVRARPEVDLSRPVSSSGQAPVEILARAITAMSQRFPAREEKASSAVLAVDPSAVLDVYRVLLDFGQDPSAQFSGEWFSGAGVMAGHTLMTWAVARRHWAIAEELLMDPRYRDPDVLLSAPRASEVMTGLFVAGWFVESRVELAPSLFARDLFARRFLGKDQEDLGFPLLRAWLRSDPVLLVREFWPGLLSFPAAARRAIWEELLRAPRKGEDDLMSNLAWSANPDVHYFEEDVPDSLPSMRIVCPLRDHLQHTLTLDDVFSSLLTDLKGRRGVKQRLVKAWNRPDQSGFSPSFRFTGPVPDVFSAQ